jgi:predicted dinucleotide-binding enzyme
MTEPNFSGDAADRLTEPVVHPVLLGPGERRRPPMTEQRPTFGIVGAGRMGRGIAQRVAFAGSAVWIYDRGQRTAAAAADAATGPGVAGEIRARPLGDVLGADIVVLAIRFPATLELAAAHRDKLANRIVVDICTPLDDTYEHLALPATDSGAEQLEQVIPQSRIVKAFNTNLGVTLPGGAIEGQPLDTFVASDDEAAKATVIGALAGSGLRALDAGALINSRVLEAMAALGIEIGDRYGLGQTFGFKYLPTRELIPAGSLET